MAMSGRVAASDRDPWGGSRAPDEVPVPRSCSDGSSGTGSVRQAVPRAVRRMRFVMRTLFSLATGMATCSGSPAASPSALDTVVGPISGLLPTTGERTDAWTTTRSRRCAT